MMERGARVGLLYGGEGYSGWSTVWWRGVLGLVYCMVERGTRVGLLYDGEGYSRWSAV